MVLIFFSSYNFLANLYQYQEHASYYYANGFEDTHEFELYHQELLGYVADALARHRTVNGFYADGLSADFDLIQQWSPTFKYRLVNSAGEALSSGAATEAINLEITSQYSASEPVILPPRYGSFDRLMEKTQALSTLIGDILPPGWTLYLSIDPYQDQGALGDAYRLFQDLVASKSNLEMLMIGYFALAGFSYLWLLVVSGKGSYESPIQLNWVDRLPLELMILLFPTAIPIYLEVLSDLSYHGGQMDFVTLVIGLNSLLAVFLLVSLSLVRRLKGRYFFKSAWTVQVLSKLFKLVSPANLQGIFKPILLVYLVLYALANVILGLFIYNGPLGILLWLGFNGLTVYFVAKELKAYRYLQDYVHQQVSGQIDTDLDQSLVTPLLKPFAQDLSALHQGLEIAVGDALKNERMRTELITNVTHDLKNPLTSIISYVDLLSKEALENSTATGYVHILQDKSQRLKILIDHLVETSKLSSGVVQAQLKSLDMVAFIKQIEGEFADAFNARRLQWVFNSTHQSIMVSADDKMLLRILENLFGNIVKYTLPGTRVYLELEEGPDAVRLTLKNISEHPIQVGAEDLMERFVRADSARNTEGNGLGLSIAQSLAAAIEGQLEIRVDGDMFKAILTLRKGID